MKRPKVLMTGGNRRHAREMMSLFHADSCYLNRSNGFDIGQSETQDLIALKSLDFDIFINYAHNGSTNGQFDLLQKVFEVWSKNKKKGHIFTFGTYATYSQPQKYLRYAVIKFALDMLHKRCCELIIQEQQAFRMTLLRPGLLLTEKAVGELDLKRAPIPGHEIANLIVELYQLSDQLFIEDVVIKRSNQT